MFLVEIELLYHSRGNWIALTVHYVNEDDVAKASPSLLPSIREELFKQMQSICQQGLRGFKFSICCQIQEALDRSLDIDFKFLPLLQKEKYKYSPRDAKLYNNFGKRLDVNSEGFSRINCWFKQSSDASSSASQGKVHTVSASILITFVSCRFSSKGNQ